MPVSLYGWSVQGPGPSLIWTSSLAPTNTYFTRSGRALNCSECFSTRALMRGEQERAKRVSFFVSGIVLRV